MAHCTAEAAVAAVDSTASPEEVADSVTRAQAALDAALSTRATCWGALRYRLTLLADTLAQDEASDYALALLRAAVADLDALSRAGTPPGSLPAAA